MFALLRELGSTDCGARGSVSGRSRRSGSRPQAPCRLTDVPRMRAVDPGEGARLENPRSDRGIMDAIVDRGVEVLSERVGSVMTREVFTCSRHDRVSAVMALMTNRRIRHVPVVEHDGRLCGIISIGDVVKHRLDEIQREANAIREYISGSR